jgi:hypothetical protein
MVGIYLIIDNEIYPKIDTDYLEAELSKIQKEYTGSADQKVGIFIICTVSTIRRRVGKWKDDDWQNYSLRIPRETVDALSRDEVSQLVIGLVKKAFKWEGQAEAA